MFSHILVPVDVSDRMGAVLDRVAELARVHASRVTLLHVIEAIEDGTGDDLDSFYAELESHAQDKLGGWAKRLTSRDIATDVAILRGKRVPEIVRFADEHDCDLTLLSTHAVDVNDPAHSLGTISHQVALLSSRAVLLLR
jgi:nucleotide-binding universal stress UspA family protein